MGQLTLARSHFYYQDTSRCNACASTALLTGLMSEFFAWHPANRMAADRDNMATAIRRFMGTTPRDGDSILCRSMRNDHARINVDFPNRLSTRSTARIAVRFGDDSVRATCLLRAYAEDHSVVGELSFTPEHDATQPIEETVRTERRATSVELIGCTAPGQPRPR